MRVGVISDIHANRVALEAVLEDMPAVDALVCAGDVVGYYPWPAECVAVLRDRKVPTIRGNHDQAVITDTTFRFNEMAAAGVELARDELGDGELEWIESLPRERHLANGRVKLVHGHPDDPDRYTFPRDFAPGLLGDEDVLVTGHTHVQHVAQFTEGIVLNPGSVGQPRDGDPTAAYAVIDLDALSVDLERTGYDIDEVEHAVARAGLPDRVGTRLHRGE